MTLRLHGILLFQYPVQSFMLYGGMAEVVRRIFTTSVQKTEAEPGVQIFPLRTTSLVIQILLHCLFPVQMCKLFSGTHVMEDMEYTPNIRQMEEKTGASSHEYLKVLLLNIVHL